MHELRPPQPPNSCRQCGSTNYHRLFARDATGVLRPSGRYKCSGCELNFTQASEWRHTVAGRLASGTDHRVGMPTRPGLSPV